MGVCVRFFSFSPIRRERERENLIFRYVHTMRKRANGKSIITVSHNTNEKIMHCGVTGIASLPQNDTLDKTDY